MFLKSLTIKGFKSFADSTVLVFEPGITVVVGPNGSGKSNVVDAVTWVLGAQGPRSLRSQKMEDVIFAGTSSRPALGRAEVSLLIDNASGRLPVELAEVTITRTLFRSGDSEYAINGTPCRLLDIQDLLSDSGVGRQQHMIIGQGQLDTVLNARPEDRRAIIEEAAGVLKHRRRKERAERRLAATQENLERLGDLVREVRRQIRPLERQAAAARSYASVAEELAELKMYLAGKEFSELEARGAKTGAELASLRESERDVTQKLAELDDAATAIAAELSTAREEDLAESLGRVQGLAERTRGIAAVLRERMRAVGAALDAAADADVVSTLEAEAAGLQSELEATRVAVGAIADDREALNRSVEELDAEERTFVETWGDALKISSAEERLGAARAEIEMLRRSGVQHNETVEILGGRVRTLEARSSEIEGELETLLKEGELVDVELSGLEGSFKDASESLADRLVGLEAAQSAYELKERDRHRTAARAEAMDRALQEVLGSGGKDLLRDVDGVVGALVDLVEIDEGWEAAFEAAAGASVAAVVVEGKEAAREALSRLRREGITGAILASSDSGGRAVVRSGAVPAFGSAVDVGALGGGVELLRDHVRPRSGGGLRDVGDVEGVAGVLDVLIGRAVTVGGWERAIDLSLDRPELVVVTREGDRFASSGWRVRSTQRLVTAAAVEAAQRGALEAAVVADEAAMDLKGARAEVEAGRRSVAELEREVGRCAAAKAAIEGRVERDRVEQRRVAAELSESREALAQARSRAAADLEKLEDLERGVPALEEAVAEALERSRVASETKGALEERREALDVRRQEIDVLEAGVAERRRVLERRLEEVERRLAGHVEEREEAAIRRRRLEFNGRALERLERVVEAEREKLDQIVESMRGAYRSQLEAVKAGGEKLEELRRARAEAEERLKVAASRTRDLEIASAEISLRMTTLAETVRADLGCEVEELTSMAEPELREGVSAKAHASDLAERLNSIGPVNPLALEELSALEERHRELDAQVSDIRGARRELQEVVRTLDQEIMESFASAEADVNEHFSTLVSMLFPGGTGRLVLTEPDDLLNTGVEVEVRPAGRNVRRVSLLSGGERSLAALAFLFAVFRSRPSPFYLMDEVEAALDDVNLHRFLDLVREFRDEAQLIIVSHQKRTMETGDALYGVTMAPGGSSQVVSQKVREVADTEAS